MHGPTSSRRTNWCKLQLGPEPVLTTLQQLDLTDVTVHGDADLIGKLTTLQQLRLCRVRVVGERSEFDIALKVLHLRGACLELRNPHHPPGTQAYVFSAGLLQQLRGLTRMDVDSCLADAGLQHLSTLTRLQDLSLGCRLQVSTEGLAGLQQLKGLTSLELSMYRWSLDRDTMPGLSELTALQRLAVTGAVLSDGYDFDDGHPTDAQLVYFHPSLLKELRQLRQLELHSVILCDHPFGAACLLDVLPQLTELTGLVLFDVFGLDLQPPAAYSALTCSSKLAYLDFRYTHYGSEDDDDADIWAGMFGRMLPKMEVLLYSAGGFGLFIDDIGVRVIAENMPSLRQLNLWQLNVPDHVSFTPLLQCSCLTSLAVMVGESWQFEQLAQLKGLHELKLCWQTSHESVPVTQTWDSALQHLTSLQLLTSLCLRSPFFQQGLFSSSLERQIKRLPRTCLFFSLATDQYRFFPFCYIANKAAEGDPPDVWSQLLNVCRKGLATTK